MQYITTRLAPISLALLISVAGCATRPMPQPISPVKKQLQKLPVDQQYGVPIYMKFTNGTWTASDTGDITQPDTERVKLFPKVGWLPDPDFPAGGLTARCTSTTEARPAKPEGYSRCNSRLFVDKDGDRVIDRSLLETLVTQTGAVELARKSEPLWQYRQRYQSLQYNNNVSDLKAFIETYASKDPDGLVNKIQQRLEQISRAAAERAIRAEQEKAQQAKAKAAREAHLRDLRVGDTIRVNSEPYVRYSAEDRRYIFTATEFRGLIIEIKGPTSVRAMAEPRTSHGVDPVVVRLVSLKQ